MSTMVPAFRNRWPAYDLSRAPRKADLAAALRRCHVRTAAFKSPLRCEYEGLAGEPAVQKAIKEKPEHEGLLVYGTVTPGGIRADISDALALDIVAGIPVAIGMNSNVEEDFGIYIRGDRLQVILYADSLLPQAEAAVAFYQYGRCDGPHNVYPSRLGGILPNIRRFAAEREDDRGAWEIRDEWAAKAYLTTGLEWRDYDAWRSLDDRAYVRACIHARATSYLIGQWVRAQALIERLSGQKPDITPEEITRLGTLAEMAFGPLPRARLGDALVMGGGLGPEFCERGRLKTRVRRVTGDTRLADQLELIRTPKAQIVAIAQGWLDDLSRQIWGTPFGEQFHIEPVAEEIRTWLRKLTLFRHTHPPQNEERKATLVKSPRPRKRRRDGVTRKPGPAPMLYLSKPPLADFVTACRPHFLGGPNDLLTVLHEIVKPKELHHIVGQEGEARARAIIDKLVRYRLALRQRYFDADMAIDEIRAVLARRNVA